MLFSLGKYQKCDRRGDRCESATPQKGNGRRPIDDAGNEVGTGDAKRCGKRDDLLTRSIFHEGLHDHQHQVGEGCRVGGSLVKTKGADADL